jgi:hypothetical protein
VFVSTSPGGYSEVLQLSGPANTCRSQVDIMRMNSHVIDIHVLDASGNEVEEGEAEDV